MKTSLSEEGVLDQGVNFWLNTGPGLLNSFATSIILKTPPFSDELRGCQHGIIINEAAAERGGTALLISGLPVAPGNRIQVPHRGCWLAMIQVPNRPRKTRNVRYEMRALLKFDGKQSFTVIGLPEFKAPVERGVL